MDKKVLDHLLGLTPEEALEKVCISANTHREQIVALEEQIEMLFKFLKTATANYDASVSALLLIHQTMRKKNETKA